MNRRAVVAMALAALAGCANTTHFRSGAPLEDETHERRTTADLWGGSQSFDLSKQCAESGGWAELTFEDRVGGGIVEQWRCRRAPAAPKP